MRADDSTQHAAVLDQRLRAVLDLNVAEAREGVGRHEYDGQIQDLSVAGVAQAVARLGSAQSGAPSAVVPHDELHLAAFEESSRVRYGELQLHRRNPLLHMENLDLSCYDRPYAAEDVRADARKRHLRKWPEAVDMALDALDQVPAPVAQALVGAVRGLKDSVATDEPGRDDALAAHARFVKHLEQLAANGDPQTAMGRAELELLMGADEAMPNVDLGDLADRATLERQRLRDMLEEGCQRLAPDVEPSETVAALMADHPPSDQVVQAAAAVTSETISFCRDRGLLTHLDGKCRVGLAPPSRRWAVAMMAWSAPYEEDGPSHYDITPPEPEWPLEEQEEWLTMFSNVALPAVTAHEVAPGHFAHGRALRHAPTDIRRSLMSAGFGEGWAHYAEELMLEEGFRADDPQYQIGVALEALVRVTRLWCAIGLHTGQMTVDDATASFMNDALMSEATARSEARRGTFDPTYGIYTWGKWVIMQTRDAARDAWGDAFTLRRFHDELLTLGSPPLGLVGAVVAQGTG
ncbi:MAG TPA: DUF885 family protein [Actinomycetes bacterium]|nr:DUF885 family protein [Actinomycetes bacterium]